MLLSTKLDLLQKGFRQVQGADYNEMLAVAIFYEIWQMDVKTEFFKWTFLKEELYMMQQEGFINPKGANKVRKL